MMIVSENCIALAALLLAASRIDAWAIVANPRLSPRELDQIRDHSGARRMFFTVGVSKEAAAHAQRYGAEIGHVGPFDGDRRRRAERGHGSPNRSRRTAAKQVAVLIYTSGTTGTPKGVMLTHREPADQRQDHGAFPPDGRPSDKVYVVLPISHIVGISLLIMTLMVGGTVRLVSKYDPAALAKAMAEEGITILNGVPATYQRLLEYKAVAGLEQLDRGSLRLIAVAGAPLDLDLKSRVEQEFGLPLSTATASPNVRPAYPGVRFDAPRSDQAVGTVLPGVEARIRTIDGMPVGERRGRRTARARPQRDARLLPRARSHRQGDRSGGLVQYRRPRALRRRCLYHRRPHQGDDHPLRLQRLSGRGRGGAQFAHATSCNRAVVGRAVDGNEEVVAFVQLHEGIAGNSRTT